MLNITQEIINSILIIFTIIMETMNNEWDQKTQLLEKILLNIEKRHWKNSFLYKVYSKPENQKKLTINKLRAIYDVQCKSHIEELSKEEQINNDISDFLNGKHTAKFYHVQKQEWFWESKRHKWDVPTHSKNVLLHYRNYISQKNELIRYFSERINGISKKSLMELAIIFHDAGKLDVYKQTWSMKWHEQFTSQNQMSEIANNFFLDDEQKKYINSIIIFHHYLPENLTEEEKNLITNNNIYIEYLILTFCDLASTQWYAVNKEDIEKRHKYVDNEIELTLKKDINNLIKKL